MKNKKLFLRFLKEKQAFYKFYFNFFHKTNTVWLSFIPSDNYYVNRNNYFNIVKDYNYLCSAFDWCKTTENMLFWMKLARLYKILLTIYNK